MKNRLKVVVRLFAAGLTYAVTVVAATSVAAYAMTEYRAAAPSAVTFHAHSTGHDFNGTSATIRGSFGCDRERIVETAHGEIAIPVSSLKTGIGARDTKMNAVFDVARFPHITFHLTKIENLRWSGADTFTATAVGELAMHGVTAPKRVPIIGAFQGEKLTVTGRLDCRITEFGMERPGFLFVRVADDVRVDFRVTGAAAPVRG